MKRILFIISFIFAFSSLFAQSDDTTKYVKYPGVYGLQYPRLWATKVLRPPTDTIYTKTGLAIIGSTLWVGNGEYWSAALNKIDSTALSGYATQYDLTQINKYRFGVSGEDDAATENRSFDLTASYYLNIQGNDVNNFFKLDPTNNFKLSHQSVSGTFRSDILADAGGGIFLASDRTDVTGTGAFVSLAPDVGNIELSMNGNIIGLQNYEYTSGKLGSLWATENPYRGIFIDSAQAFIGKGPSSNSVFLRGIRLYQTDLSVFLDSLTNNTSQDVLVGMINAAGATQGQLGYLTTGYGIDIASGVLKADTSELATQYDISNFSATMRFAVSGEDERATGDRYFSAAGNQFNLDSISSGSISYDGSNGFFLFDYTNSYNMAFRATAVVGAQIFSQDNDNYVQAEDAGITLSLGTTSDALIIPNIPYNSSARLVHLAVDTVDGRVYRKTASGGSTPGIDDVLAIGQALTSGRTIATGSNTLVVSTSTSLVTPFNVQSTTGSSAVFSNTADNIQVLTLSKSTSATNILVPSVAIQHTTTGTAAAGFGSYIRFDAEVSNGTAPEQGRIDFLWQNATAGSETTWIDFRGKDNAVSERFINIQPALIRFNNDADTVASLQDVRDMAGGGGGGYTNLTEFVDQTAWRIFYSNTDGDVVELALGANGEYLMSNGASSAPSWSTPSGSGTVNTGAQYLAAYYPGAGTTVDDWAGLKLGQSGINTEIVQQATTDVALRIQLISSSAEDALQVKNSGGTTLTYIDESGHLRVPAGSSTARSLTLGSNGFYELGDGFGFWGNANGTGGFIGTSGLIFRFNTSSIDFGQQGTFSTVNRIRMTAPAEGHVKFHSLGLTAAGILEIAGGEGAASSLYLTTDEGDDATDRWELLNSTANVLQIVNNSTAYLELSSAGVLKLNAVVQDDAETKVLVWNSTDKEVQWRDASTLGGGGGALDDLSDVVITAAATGEYLRYNGTNWVDATIEAGDVPTLNQNTTGSAATLTTTRTIWGQNFNGSANITGDLTITDANFIFGTTTGTKIGTATSQKIGFFNATPIVQPSGSVVTALSNLGLVTSGSLAAADLTGSVATARLTNVKQTKTWAINAPTTSDDFGFFTNQAITITNVTGVMLGSSQSVTLTINYGDSRATADGTIVASNTFDSGDSGYQTTGFGFTLNTTSIPAGTFVWLDITAVSGTIAPLEITIEYNLQ